MKFSHAVLFLFAAIIVAFMFMVHPEQALQAALRGIAIWWEILFPALLPFLVLAEMMLGFGVVHFIGTFLDPLMRPLFRVPGTGGFVMAMGFASGYPVAAKLAAQLRSKQLVSRIEAQRLVNFCTTADPIFLIGAVSVGFFQSPKLAPILLISHYGAAVAVGLIMRYYGSGELPLAPASTPKNSGSLLHQALKAMHQARMEDSAPAGRLLKRAISGALEIILLLGGLVIFISVMLEMLAVSGFMHYFHSIVKTFLLWIHLPEGLTKPLVDGLFEVTIGAKAAAEATGIGAVYQVVAACLIVSWGGLSVHAQIAGLISHTDLRYGPFLTARFLHGLLSAALAFFIWQQVML